MPITAAKARKISNENRPLSELEQLIDEIDECIEMSAEHGHREAEIDFVEDEHRRRIEAYYRKRKFKVGRNKDSNMKIMW